VLNEVKQRLFREGIPPGPSPNALAPQRSNANRRGYIGILERMANDLVAKIGLRATFNDATCFSLYIDRTGWHDLIARIQTKLTGFKQFKLLPNVWATHASRQGQSNGVE